MPVEPGTIEEYVRRVHAGGPPFTHTIYRDAADPSRLVPAFTVRTAADTR